MLQIQSAGFLLAGQPLAAAPGPFPLEGQKDVFRAIGKDAVDGGPLPPSLGAHLKPALKALSRTTRALGPNPSPWDVDVSNLRRLVRATLSVVEAHRASFDEKDYRRGTRELRKLASVVGRYKDAGILEDTVRSQFPGGVIPSKIEKALSREKSRRAEDFDQAWKHFQETGLKRVKRSLGKPQGLEASPAGLQREDERRNRQHVASLLDTLHETGLQHECPDAFHEGRKALRRVVHATLAARETVPVSEEDLQRMSGVVDGLGVAQDHHIAYTWLERKGFEREAGVARARYAELHAAELDGVAELLASGTLDRVRDATRLSAAPTYFAPPRMPAPEKASVEILA